MSDSAKTQKTYMLNMGPAHPAMHGVVRLVLVLGDVVRCAFARAGMPGMHQRLRRKL